MIDSLFLFVDRKYVDSRSPSSGWTNGGPQPRVSSPLPGLSTLITRAPRSPSIIAGVRPGQGPGQVDDEDAVEWSGHAGSPFRSQPAGTTTNTSQASSGPTATTIAA